MLSQKEIIESQKLLASCTNRMKEYLVKNEAKIPADKLTLYKKVLGRFDKINLLSVSEMDWKIALEATKLFGATEIKGDVLKIFRIVTDVYNAG